MENYNLSTVMECRRNACNILITYNQHYAHVRVLKNFWLSRFFVLGFKILTKGDKALFSKNYQGEEKNKGFFALIDILFGNF